jgi:hypothetical protein
MSVKAHNRYILKRGGYEWKPEEEMGDMFLLRLAKISFSG